MPDDGALTIHADAQGAGRDAEGRADASSYDADPARHLYLVPSAKVRVNGVEAEPRDGIAITGEEQITIEAEADAELVLVDAR